MGEFGVAVVGAGMAGLYLGDQLRQHEIKFTIFEKASAVGGAWRDNDYPGLHCDVMIRNYEFAHARYYGWSHRYAPGPEIRRYLEDFAEAAGLYPHILFGTEIVAAEYDAGRWTLRSRGGEVFSADIVVGATGFLHRPVIPRIPGAESFRGAAFHSAGWDHTVRLSGRRVGVIGMGSSGVQIVSALGKQSIDVTHFIRTPQWIQKRRNARISSVERLILRHPRLAGLWDSWLRWNKIRIEGGERWRLEPGPEREKMTQRFRDDLARQVLDPELRAKLTPDYEVGCKRIPKSADIYQVMQRPNVRPIFGPIARIEPDGVVDAEGHLHELDVLVYATGFDSHAYMRPMQVVGVDGTTVDELWSDGVYSYRGVALPKLPNFFLLNGPFAPVNSLAIPSLLNDEVGYLLRLIKRSADGGTAFAPTEEATERFRAEVRSALPGTTFVSCRNWFMDSSGTPIVWPWTRARHAEQFVELDLADFQAFDRGAAESPPGEILGRWVAGVREGRAAR
jgi:cation diffusion facilitator CzcD-associated flavoprotein CzcO